MALLIENQTRKIEFKRGNETITLTDLPDYSIEQMRKFYAAMYPELATAAIDGPKSTQDGVVYTFKTVLGTKG